MTRSFSPTPRSATGYVARVPASLRSYTTRREQRAPAAATGPRRAQATRRTPVCAPTQDARTQRAPSSPYSNTIGRASRRLPAARPVPAWEGWTRRPRGHRARTPSLLPLRRCHQAARSPPPLRGPPVSTDRAAVGNTENSTPARAAKAACPCRPTEHAYPAQLRFATPVGALARAPPRISQPFSNKQNRHDTRNGCSWLHLLKQTAILGVSAHEKPHPHHRQVTVHSHIHDKQYQQGNVYGVKHYCPGHMRV